ncbi:MAG: sulfatase-like hydrolase/transferase [Verrucomicrobiales bacterium]|nr:sulfatase-like hydrolase/transferase [Verrucomicrobiales bacterium]
MATTALQVVAAPNVVFILADDLGRECLECYGGESYRTPNLNRLAQEGTRFEGCYATPMCSPTRCMLMTGRHNFRNYVQWARADFDQPMLAREMKRGGYDTALFGKWHLGGWDEAPFGPTRAGFDRYATWNYEVVVQETGKIGNQYWKTEVQEDGRAHRLEGYGPAYYEQAALDFIRAHADEKAAPFFIDYALVHAHRPFVPGDEDEATNEERITGAGDLKWFPDMVAYIDRTVGRVLAVLEETGQLDNTVVFFSADNGTDNVSVAKELRSRWRGGFETPGGKYLPTELGANVPLLVRGPGIPAGRVLKSPVDFTDMLPTLCAIAEVEPPARTDGENLWPMLRGGEETTHDGLAYTWGVYEHSSKKYKTPQSYADELQHFVRDARWKLSSNGDLFDLENWQDESPLPADAQPEVRARLRRALDGVREQGERLW